VPVDLSMVEQRYDAVYFIQNDNRNQDGEVRSFVTSPPMSCLGAS
jgi:hypothetical protein